MTQTKASAAVTKRKSATVESATGVKAKRSGIGRAFVPAKTGRIVKLSPAPSRLGLERIRAAVQTVVAKSD